MDWNTAGRNPLEEMEQPSWSTEEPEIAVLGCNPKDDRMISVHFQGKPFNITVIQVQAPNSIAEAAEVEWFYKDLQELLELTPKKKKMSFSLQETGMQKQDVKRYLE